jgi:hypothetical protein
VTAIATRYSMMALVASLLLPACAAEDMDDVAVASSESAMTSSQFLAQTQIVGSLSYGETSATISYKNPAKFRAFKFAGDAGDVVSIDVRSTNGGDAIAWVLDDSFVTIASNDDASTSTLDSHIDVTLPAHPSRTHYIVFRDYGYKARKFVVTLAGSAAPSPTACTQDSDCTKILGGCCSNAWTAIHAGSEAAYRESLQCPIGRMCPLFVPNAIDDVAQCNNNTHQCELVDPLAVSCGGHVRNMHTCPDGFVCEGAGLPVDATGACRKPCGGFANLGCPDSFTCVDDPTDECDVEHGGADCGGICQPKTCGGFGNLSCPDSMDCIDDPNDSCDVATGGRDCGSLCANR